MKNIKTLALTALISIGTSMGYAGEIDHDALGLVTKQKSLEKDHCRETRDGGSLCMQYEIAYPLITEARDEGTKEKITEAIEPYIQKFEALNPKGYVDEVLKDGDNISGTWEQSVEIDIISSTRSTFTLSIKEGGYTGGAHPNYYTSFVNYNAKSGRKIGLRDIFVQGYEPKLIEIASKHYRETNHLAPNESLVKLDWFQNKFELASMVAIKPEGIYFFYNSYEIKPYSSGVTTLLVPYSKLGSIMKQGGIIK